MPKPVEIPIKPITPIVQIVQIVQWQQLSIVEQQALGALLGVERAAARFEQELNQAGRDTLVNIYYLLTSARVAGDLWSHLQTLKWAEANQLGVEVASPETLHSQIISSGNFRADSWVTCYFKHACWSLREVVIDGVPISQYGLQVYRPDNKLQPGLLVIDIDTIVFSAFYTWPRHALDILRPDPSLNDPLRVRETLRARGIYHV